MPIHRSNKITLKNSISFTDSANEQNQAMRRYYKLQAQIYDATRWTFLFGRNRILNLLPFPNNAPITILEIGCGTGHNLKRLASIYPNAHLIGLDVSGDMIEKSAKNTKSATNRVTLVEKPYMKGESQFTGKVDAILFSYSLTMINPQWKDLLEQAYQDLKPGGAVAVVDFYNSRYQWFKQHMGNNHVRMDGHLLPVLRADFEPLVEEIKGAYGGVWEYFLFVGKKR